MQTSETKGGDKKEGSPLQEPEHLLQQQHSSFPPRQHPPGSCASHSSLGQERGGAAEPVLLYSGRARLEEAQPAHHCQPKQLPHAQRAREG